MGTMRRLAVLAALLSLTACGGGGGGGGGGTPNGRPYAYLDWTADIQAADFTQIGVPSPFYANTRYRLTVGPGRVFWSSDWLGSCCTAYYLDVQVQAGTPGYDRVYLLTISQDTLYYSEGLVPAGTASVSSEDAARAAPSAREALPGLAGPSSGLPWPGRQAPR
jgi:hypothetical protein